MKLCVDCKHYRLNLQTYPSRLDLAAKNALCAVKHEKVKDAVTRDSVTGVIVPDESRRNQALCVIQRIPWFPADLIMRSCGRRARWFKKLPPDSPAQPGSDPTVHGKADGLPADSA